jgi:hypothetical protein
LAKPSSKTSAGISKPRLSLAYSGQAIRDDDEFLCLTDMWKSAGGDAGRKPAEWLRSAQAEDFLAFVAESKEVEISHLIRKTRGQAGQTGGGATWAHWQIAFAYAKWISPAFHAWCNEAAREAMRGRAVVNDRIKLYIVETPAEYRRLWEDEAIDALAHLYRIPRDAKRGFPVWLCGIAGKLYDRIWTSPVANKVRDMNPHAKGVKYFQHLSEQARQMTLAELSFIRSLAETSASPDEFWGRVNQRYLGEPFQLSFGSVPMLSRDGSGG